MKLSIYTLLCPEYTLEQAAEKIAALGIEGIEWRVGGVADEIHFDPRDPGRFWGSNQATLNQANLEADARRAAAITKQHGLEPSFLAGGPPADDLDSIRKQMEAALIIGAPALRVSAGGGDAANLSDRFDNARKAWDGVEKLAEETGVKAVIEVHHGSLVPTCSAARRLLDGRDPAKVGVLYDPGNMTYEGFERPEYGLDILGPYLAHVHVKNARPYVAAADGRRCLKWGYRNCEIRLGMVDWAAQVKALAAVGYDGFLSLENFNAETQADEKMSDFSDLFRSILADLEA